MARAQQSLSMWEGDSGKGCSCLILDAQLQGPKGRDLRRQLQALGVRALCSCYEESSLVPDHVDIGVGLVSLCQVSYHRLSSHRRHLLGQKTRLPEGAGPV